jgi:formylglycine-generating enzyme required for sulfatase activity
MVVLSRGDFMMGSPKDEPGRADSEGPQHRVAINYDLAVGKYEVTFAEWDACVDAGGCGNYRPGDQGWGRDRRPVINVSWNDAQAYVQWLSRKSGQKYRLLSEAEWEYAARAGTTTAYWWGREVGRNNANCGSCGSQWDGKQTAPAGSFWANSFGLYDVHGNVWEWVEDCWHNNYNGAPSNGSAWTDDNNCSRGLRGGSWVNYPWVARAALRDYGTPGSRSGNLGFRVARTLPPAP